MASEPMTEEDWRLVRTAIYRGFASVELELEEAKPLIQKLDHLRLALSTVEKERDGLREALRWARKRLHDELAESSVKTEEDLLDELHVIDDALAPRQSP